MPTSESVCAVCSCYVEPRLLSEHTLPHPGLELLRADGKRSDTLPRAALTTYIFRGITYCLQPFAISIVHGSRLRGVATMQICKACSTSLKNGNVPRHSLVRVDTGAIPRAPCADYQLLPLRMFEERLVAPLHVMRMCYVVSSAGAVVGGDAETLYPSKLHGHVFAFQRAAGGPAARTADAL
jgi:hypothetical protein